jgi:hypothetical protein
MASVRAVLIRLKAPSLTAGLNLPNPALELWMPTIRLSARSLDCQAQTIETNTTGSGQLGAAALTPFVISRYITAGLPYFSKENP